MSEESAPLESMASEEDTSVVREPKEGYIITIFRGQNHRLEVDLYRRICMRFGLQAYKEI